MAYQGNYYRPSMFGGFSFFPPVIKGLLIANAAVFVLVRFFGSFSIAGYPLALVFNNYLGLMPFDSGFYPWQLVTYMFMHADFWHLFFNMLFGLWMFGMEVEHTWGSRKFLFFYLLCGVAAGISQLILGPLLEPTSMHDIYGNGIPTIGASGAVYGVLLAFGMLFPDRYIFLYFLLPIKAKYFVAGLILLGVLYVGRDTGIANLAHLGGALTGYLYIMYDTRRLPLQGVIDKIKWWMRSNSLSGSTKPEDQEDSIREAKYFDINETKKNDQDATQKEIDKILDKISRGGYQSLTEEEKRILFEASKKLN